MMNGTHRPAHKAGKHIVQAGLALTAPLTVKNAVSKLCSIRRRSPGNPALPLSLILVLFTLYVN